MDRKTIADGIATRARELAYGGKLTSADVVHIDALATSLFSRFPAAAPSTPAPAPVARADLLTARVAIELVEHEAIVLESYLDSAGVWTWGIGVTAKAGYDVMQHKDRPSTVEHVLEVYLGLLHRVYVPQVVRAFAGFTLNEAQFAAALSFAYNTGAIERTDWVSLVKAGRLAAARTFLETHYLNGGDLADRRAAEANLFFDGVWAGDGNVVMWPVAKPSYRPDWSHPRLIDIRADMDKAIAA